ncbi:MAG: SAM-dependent methyltransferase, partial [Alistipes sp.]|nr:SAM-dependent methyltransferase [Alistipes sp.]
VVSLGGECKEVNIYTGSEHERLTIAAIGLGTWHFCREDMHATATAEPFTPEEYRYLLIPDVALQKGRVAIAALKPYADIWSNNGYAFARELPPEHVGARIYAIESIERYHPRELKRRYKGVGIEILKRDTPLGIEVVRKALGARSGRERTIALTNIAGESWFIELKS